jgi:hypothetical protein
MSRVFGRCRTPVRKVYRERPAPAEHAVLWAYARGELSPYEAMRRLGIYWYGQLPDKLSKAGLERVRPAREAEMTKLLVHLLRRRVKKRAARKQECHIAPAVEAHRRKA